MEGCVCMRKLGYNEQLIAISNYLNDEIQRLDTLPPEEAMLEAQKGLESVGIMDSKGNFAPPYTALEQVFVR